MAHKNDKSLGQHWLKDRSVLADIASYGELSRKDTVLEIGPGLGTLTSELLRHAGRVVAVEFDADLAAKLPKQFPGTNLQIVNDDILKFDLTSLPDNYKVVANVPYYITGKIIKLLLNSSHPPALVVLLIQKEVAERLSARPGEMSVLAVSAQVFADVSLGSVVPSGLFTPPPKVDSQIVIMHRRSQSFFVDITQVDFFRVVKAGFSAKRKKLRTSLAGGLGVTKDKAEAMLAQAKIDPNNRAEDLSLNDWANLTKVVL